MKSLFFTIIHRIFIIIYNESDEFYKNIAFSRSLAFTAIILSQIRFVNCILKEKVYPGGYTQSVIIQLKLNNPGSTFAVDTEAHIGMLLKECCGNRICGFRKLG